MTHIDVNVCVVYIDDTMLKNEEQNLSALSRLYKENVPLFKALATYQRGVMKTDVARFAQRVKETQYINLPNRQAEEFFEKLAALGAGEMEYSDVKGGHSKFFWKVNVATMLEAVGLGLAAIEQKNKRPTKPLVAPERPIIMKGTPGIVYTTDTGEEIVLPEELSSKSAEKLIKIIRGIAK